MLHELPCVSILSFTCFENGHDASDPFPPPFAPSALRVSANADEMAESLLCEVVGRLVEFGLLDETKQRLPVFDKPLLEGRCLSNRHSVRMQVGKELSL